MNVIYSFFRSIGIYDNKNNMSSIFPIENTEINTDDTILNTNLNTNLNTILNTNLDTNLDTNIKTNLKTNEEKEHTIFIIQHNNDFHKNKILKVENIIEKIKNNNILSIDDIEFIQKIGKIHLLEIIYTYNTSFIKHNIERIYNNNHSELNPS